MTLLVFKVNQLGDNVVFLPVIQGLMAALPGWKIVIATSPVAAPLYRVTCPGTEVLEFETAAFNAAWRSPQPLSRLIAQIRKIRPTACLVASDQGNVAHLLARLSGATLTLGQWVPGRRLGFLLHHRERLQVDAPMALQNWQLAQAILRWLGYTAIATGTPPPPDLSGFGRTGHDRIIIHPGGSRAYQRWPLERYVALANQLVQTHPVLWISQGQETENQLSPEIQSVSPASLEEFIRQMAGSTMFIGNNSGPMHLASALGIPSVILMGPSAYTWDPYWHRDRFDLMREPVLPCQPCDTAAGPANVCRNLEHPMACLERWDVEQVHEKICQRLNKQD